jgi:serine/threonine protein kinase
MENALHASNLVSLLAGSRSIDAFEKIELLGAGTYGKVYKARDRISNEIVAIKRSSLVLSRTPEAGVCFSTFSLSVAPFPFPIVLLIFYFTYFW